MEYKFLAALLGLLLLACSSIHAAYANTEESNIHAEKTLPLEYPAVFGVDELLRQPSRDQHNEMVSRKLLRGAVKRGLTQSEKEEYSRLQAKRSESNDGEHVLDRDLESKKIAGIANAHHELLSGASLNHISTQNERKSMTANEPNKLVAANMQVTPRQMYEKPSFHVDYSGPKTHSPKHH